MSVATSFIKRMKTTFYVNTYKEWREQYDLYYFNNLIKDYIVPFLASHGYILNNSLITTKRIEAYLWAHTWTQKYESQKEVTYGPTEHNGSEDDYHWFLEIIDTFAWSTIFDSIEENGIFDDSFEGQMQRSDFSLFIWKQINLENSKSYIKTSSMRECYKDDDYDSDKVDE